MNIKQSTILKALAILMVAAYHFQFNLVGSSWQVVKGQGLIDWLSQIIKFAVTQPELAFTFPMYFGFIGVHLFFVLSGYGLAKKYLVSGRSKPTAKNIWRQTTKLLLPYWIAMPVTHLLNYSLRVMSYDLGITNYLPTWWQIYQPRQYVESFFVFTRWFSDRLALNFVGTWWFVGILLQFYLLIPLLVYLARKLGAKRLFVLSLGVTFVYRIWVAEFTTASPVGLANAHLLPFINFPARWAEFALGMYLATWPKLKFGGRHMLMGTGVLLLGIITSTYVVGLAISDLLMALGAILIGGAILNSKKLLEKLRLGMIGRRSYEIYLYHEPALNIIMSWFR